MNQVPDRVVDIADAIYATRALLRALDPDDGGPPDTVSVFRRFDTLAARMYSCTEQEFRDAVSFDGPTKPDPGTVGAQPDPGPDTADFADLADRVANLEAMVGLLRHAATVESTVLGEIRTGVKYIAGRMAAPNPDPPPASPDPQPHNP